MEKHEWDKLVEKQDTTRLVDMLRAEYLGCPLQGPDCMVSKFCPECEFISMSTTERLAEVNRRSTLRPSAATEYVASVLHKKPLVQKLLCKDMLWVVIGCATVVGVATIALLIALLCPEQFAEMWRHVNRVV